jgi:hypothetical protein
MGETVGLTVANMAANESATAEKEYVTFADFLTSTPPDVEQEIVDLAEIPKQNPSYRVLATPDILLHCDSEECQGLRFFYCLEGRGDIYLTAKHSKNTFVTYLCRNCRQNLKVFSLALYLDADNTTGHVSKFGEAPPFGLHTPARVITLIGPDRDLFLQGRRAENRGMGIGAFSYYRRVVDNQKGRIIAEIARVAEKLGAKPDVLKAFKSAETETQFSKAVEEIKHGIPETLLVDGHNPLTLLHTALSEGLHAGTDAECLEIAQEIRLVLTDLAERISQALKEEAELKTAVTRLLNRKSGSPAQVE